MQVGIAERGPKAEVLAQVCDQLSAKEESDTVEVSRAIRDTVSVRLAGANDSDHVAVVVGVEIAAEILIPPDVAAAPKTESDTPPTGRGE